MFNIFKKIFQRIGLIKVKSNLEILIENGYLKVGENVQLEKLSINIYKKKAGFCNVIIGDNCMLNGTITIYNADAQVKIGDRVFIGPDTELFCYSGITIEDDVMLSWGITIIDTDAHGLSWDDRKNDVVDWMKGSEYKNWSAVKSSPVSIKCKSWIGFKSVILKGVTVSEGTIIGAGSVVSKDSNPFTVVAGNPAVFIKKVN